MWAWFPATISWQRPCSSHSPNMLYFPISVSVLTFSLYGWPSIQYFCPWALTSAQVLASVPLPPWCRLRFVPAKADLETRIRGQRFIRKGVPASWCWRRESEARKRKTNKEYVLRRLYGQQQNGWGGGAAVFKPKAEVLIPHLPSVIAEVAPRDVNSPVIQTWPVSGLREMPQAESAGACRRTLPACTETGGQGDVDRGTCSILTTWTWFGPLYYYGLWFISVLPHVISVCVWSGKNKKQKNTFNYSLS